MLLRVRIGGVRVGVVGMVEDVYLEVIGDVFVDEGLELGMDVYAVISILAVYFPQCFSIKFLQFPLIHNLKSLPVPLPLHLPFPIPIPTNRMQLIQQIPNQRTLINIFHSSLVQAIIHTIEEVLLIVIMVVVGVVGVVGGVYFVEVLEQLG